MIQISKKTAEALKAFLDAFDLHVTGVWPTIEESMRDEFGIEEPEDALEAAREELQKHV